MTTSRRLGSAATVAVAVGLTAILGACAGPGTPTGSSRTTVTPTTVRTTENNAPGDIPDSQVYVPFTSADRLVDVSVPEGWSRTTDGGATIFSDKSSTMRLQTVTQATPPTVDSVKAVELPGIAAGTAGYQAGSVSAVQRTAGPAVLVTYQASAAPNAVTTKSVTDSVERYEFWHNGHTAILTLSSPVGADNVDPWLTITNSLRWH
jgi:hypothetical protein